MKSGYFKSLLFVLSVAVLPAHGQFRALEYEKDLQQALAMHNVPPFHTSGTKWVDSVYASMSLTERIGQLFMVAAYSNKDEAHNKEIEQLIKKHHVGGLIFFQGGPGRQVNLTNRYQATSKIPLLIAMDAEWGLGMRLDSVISYPKQMALGAIENNALLFAMGQDIASQCKRIGVHINFAPVVDINSNPANPVINYRSFGQNGANVADKGIAYMRGMQSLGVLGVAKHFPGHGDTDTDSHLDLPIINHSKKRLLEEDLFPFKKMSHAGTGGMMVAHLYIPAIDNTPNLASTLSHKVVNDLLIDTVGFKGLIFTDALNMKGVSKFWSPGELEVKALLAGNDVLLFPENVPVAIQAIQKAIADSLISLERIELSVKKILKAKYWAGLNVKPKPISTNNLSADLHLASYKLNQRNLIENSLTLLKNKDQVLPVKSLENKRIAVVSIGAAAKNELSDYARKYARVDAFSISKTASAEEMKTVFEDLANYDMVIAGVFGLNNSRSKRYGITSQMINITSGLSVTNDLVTIFFGNAYGLEYLPAVENSKALIVAYEDNALTREMAAQAIFGGTLFKGKLPVSAGELFKQGSGLETSEQIRFKYTLPEELGIPEFRLRGIEEIAQMGINEGAYPGCQVLIAKEGKVFYNKSFGYHTYSNKEPVTDESIYDVASITKIASSLLAYMHMHQAEQVDLDHELCDYIPNRVDNTPYAEIKVRDMLAHQAGLVAWLPFYKRTLFNGYPRYQYYSAVQSDAYPDQVAKDLYMRANFLDSIFYDITRTPLKPSKEYLYSDLGYFFLKEIIETKSGVSLDQYVEKNFYEPMGLRTTTYNPLNQFSQAEIAPTEYDMAFRRQLVHGYVHDPGAAMMGGVGGHAGLFSNANDLAKIMQLYMSGGQWGGRQYLTESLIREYTKCQFCDNRNRRGAGFDKPVRDGEGGPTCSCVSLESFGHTGFTGTMAWADPEKQVVYIFLSNRIHPSAENKKLITLGIRSNIMEVIYDAIEQSEQLAQHSKK